MIRKIKCEVHYPWGGIEPDIEYVEIDEEKYDTPITQKNLEEVAIECIEDMIWNRISACWKEVTE